MVTEWASEKYAMLKHNGIELKQLSEELGISRIAMYRLMRRDNKVSTREKVDDAVNRLIERKHNDH